jgi:2-polyprenyl-6-methoxyphenol 4-hydroxylase
VGASPKPIEIAIVGGGMVGLSLALLLARQEPGVRVVVIEPIAFGPAGVEPMPPSFDARSTALSESTREIFEGLDLWQDLDTDVCPIETIHVSDRGHPGATRLSAGESGLKGLGYVIENRLLGDALMSAVRACANIQVMAPEKVAQLRPRKGGMEVVFESGTESLGVSLAIVADGANSGTLEKLGIYTEIRDYGQMALVTNLGLAGSHQGVAYERFTDEGPMALLPLLPADGEQRAALVWTLPPDKAAALRDAGEEAFLERVQQRFGFRAGRFVRCGSRHCYPLSLMVAQEQIRSHLVVAGNAAHFLHPVAGQGFNLALRDVAQLSAVLVNACRRGEAPGTLAVLERYLEAQKRDQSTTIDFSDSLPRVFGLTLAPAIALRNAGLISLDLLPFARREFARFGAGLAATGVRSEGRL